MIYSTEHSITPWEQAARLGMSPSQCERSQLGLGDLFNLQNHSLQCWKIMKSQNTLLHQNLRLTLSLVYFLSVWQCSNIVCCVCKHCFQVARMTICKNQCETVCYKVFETKVSTEICFSTFLYDEIFQWIAKIFKRGTNLLNPLP